MDYKSIIKDIKSKTFKPLYLLQGDEGYYIDVIVKELQKNVLKEHEKDFNETIVYGKDCDVLSVITDASAYPMMSDYKLVIIKEAQYIKDKDLEILEKYTNNPSASTVFVLALKYKKLDARKKVTKNFSSKGIVFNSEKLKDYQLGAWLSDFLKSKNYTITPKANTLLVDSLGNDLSRIVNELDKLSIIVQSGTTINEVHIEENIGISKDYNVFELNNAILIRDFVKAIKIADYFKHNPKSGPLPQIISSLYTLFSRIMRIHFSKDSSESYLASYLKLHPFVVKELMKGIKIFPPKKAAANISILHEYDLKSKGVNNSNFTDSDLLKELIYKLLH
jgi:DNA polymerase III subunit delta